MLPSPRNSPRPWEPLSAARGRWSTPSGCRSSRQVGSSGQTVKPKIYLACGMSGSFQHLAGIKGNPFLVAINKNPKAPIFQVADIGIVADILEFLPELTNKIREVRGAAHSR